MLAQQYFGADPMSVASSPHSFKVVALPYICYYAVIFVVNFQTLYIVTLALECIILLVYYELSDFQIENTFKD